MSEKSERICIPGNFFKKTFILGVYHNITSKLLFAFKLFSWLFKKYYLNLYFLHSKY